MYRNVEWGGMICTCHTLVYRNVEWGHTLLRIAADWRTPAYCPSPTHGVEEDETTEDGYPYGSVSDFLCRPKSHDPEKARNRALLFTEEGAVLRISSRGGVLRPRNAKNAREFIDWAGENPRNAVKTCGF